MAGCRTLRKHPAMIQVRAGTVGTSGLLTARGSYTYGSLEDKTAPTMTRPTLPSSASRPPTSARALAETSGGWLVFFGQLWCRFQFD